MRFADRVVVLGDGRVHQVGTPDELNLRPADAQVAGLVGYDNLVGATVQPDGAVLVGGAPTGLVHLPASGHRPGPATVAVFAAGVRLVDAECAGVPLRVARVTVGPGRREVTLAGAVALVAHLAPGLEAPSPGDEVRVVLREEPQRGPSRLLAGAVGRPRAGPARRGLAQPG